MAICTQCGRANPEDARFCNGCAAALDNDRAHREERKVISVLFCDLVGATSAADSVDPEDVRRILREYHVRVRTEIERFGGVVEKFIGDAAVGVWGVPRAYEDDPERAIRAGLPILEAVDLEVRLAINTGEVVVSVDSRVDPGEGVVGDVMNTAARLQSAAPVDSIIVGESTMRRTRRTIKYEALDAVVVKGKRDPIPIWRVIGLARSTDTAKEAPGTRFVGRKRELQLLDAIYQRAVQEPGMQLISVVGEPGVGKSRLVAEFDRSLVDAESATRLHGRCLAYGDGIGFWPLAEAVKQYLGLNESASADEARARLEEAVAGMTDSGRIRARVAPLIGLEGESGERDEVFSAWQGFFDAIAAQRPLVLVFEDLHWAHQAMLAFVRHLAEWSTGVPIVVLCTARPELFEAHPHWGGGLPNATTVALRPLDESETTELVDALLATGAVATPAHAVMAERCGGNPLYAEEYARLLGERRASAFSSVEMPETIQALIAARIDTLAPARKVLLHDAAVIGKVFWAGAIAALGAADPETVKTDLHELSRKELIRRGRGSSIPGDVEYAFWHDLVHHVAYEQLPRSDRAAKHQRAAAWIEETAGGRIGDRAEVIAHHYEQALAYLRALAESVPDALRRNAVRYLTLAGERAQGLDREHAQRLLERARGLSIPEDPERARILSALGECEFHAGESDEANRLLAEAESAAEALGDVETLGEIYQHQYEIIWVRGDAVQVRRHVWQSVERLRRQRPTKALPRLVATAAFLELAAGNYEAVYPLVEETLKISQAVDDRIGIAYGMEWRGLTDAQSGRSDGLQDLAAADEILVQEGSSLAFMGQLHVGDAVLLWRGPAEARLHYQEAIERAERACHGAWEMWARAEMTWSLADAGAWDDLLVEADIVLAWEREHGSGQPGLIASAQKARVLALRGDLAAARATIEGLEERATQAGDPQVLAPTLATLALIDTSSGSHSRGRRLISDLGDAARSELAPLAEICRLAVACGAQDDAAVLLESITNQPPRTRHAVVSARAQLAEANGEVASALAGYENAARHWESFGNPCERAQALAGQARCLSALGRAKASYDCKSAAAAIFTKLRVAGPAFVNTPHH